VARLLPWVCPRWDRGVSEGNPVTIAPLLLAARPELLIVPILA
jgi:hypothetical protein